MIVSLEGKVVKKEPTFLHVKLTNGITYGVFVSLQTSASLEVGKVSELFIKEIIREDAHLLYGFLQSDEQSMFEALLKVNGVGATTAMAVCSTLSPQGFSQALMHSNIEAFKKVPGIGPKTAKRVLVELSEFNLSGEVSPVFSEAVLALESLGFKKDKITKVLKDCQGSNTSDIIKQALKKL